MKAKLLMLLLAIQALAHAEIDFSKPIEVIALPDGRILRNVNVQKFNAESVLLKHKNGIMSLRYEFLPEEIRIEAEKRRPGGSRYFKGEMAANSDTIEGQVFLNTRGNSSYKFSDVAVYVFNQEVETIITNMTASPVQLPRPLGKAMTDADGRFKVKVPKSDPYFLFCSARRLNGEGIYEFYEWRLSSSKIAKKDRINLSRPNATILPSERIVKIEEVE